MSQQTRKPENYVVCVATEGSCPLRESCLRNKLHRETVYTKENSRQQLTVVNLWYAALKPLTRECEMYRKAEPIRFARGFKHLYDKVPKGIFKEVQMQVKRLFSCERAYYYCKSGTYLTSPEEQQKIALIFERYDIPESPQYDAFEDCYDWS